MLQTACAPKHRWRILVGWYLQRPVCLFWSHSSSVVTWTLWILHCPSSMSTGLSCFTREHWQGDSQEGLLGVLNQRGSQGRIAPFLWYSLRFGLTCDSKCTAGTHMRWAELHIAIVTQTPCQTLITTLQLLLYCKHIHTTSLRLQHRTRSFELWCCFFFRLDCDYGEMLSMFVTIQHLYTTAPDSK